jgi:hypothetical protein
MKIFSVRWAARFGGFFLEEAPVFMGRPVQVKYAD